MRPIWRSTLTAATVAVLAATTASPSNAVEQNGAGDKPPLVGSTAWLGRPADRPVTVTLVNGDRVLVTNGTTVTMLPREDGSQPIVETRRVGDDVYVYPADVVDALAAGRVDEELFNVTGLVRQGYDDAHSATMPLIAQYADPAAPTVAPRGAETGVVLESIGGVALSEDKATASAFWADLTNPRSRAAGSIEKLWLDRKVEATLDQSTAQVNAPDAWSAGFDGDGATVAILDTGADAEHPDLQGRIIAGEDFTESGSWNDGNGHGTHVASTVGGSGAGQRRREEGRRPGGRSAHRQGPLRLGRRRDIRDRRRHGVGGRTGRRRRVHEPRQHRTRRRLHRPHGDGRPVALREQRQPLRDRGRQQRTGEQHGLLPRLRTCRAHRRRRRPRRQHRDLLQPRAGARHPRAEARDQRTRRGHLRRRGRRTGRLRLPVHVGYLDGDPARRGSGGDRQAAPPRLDRRADQGRPGVVGADRHPGRRPRDRRWPARRRAPPSTRR